MALSMATIIHSTSTTNQQQQQQQQQIWTQQTDAGVTVDTG